MSRSKKDIQPHWRPNFVNAAGLPDIKAIRTDFIINFVSVVLMLLAGCYVLQREYRAYSLRNTIEDMEKQILVAESDDKKNLALSREFRDAAAHILEMEKFYATPVLAHDFLTQIIQMRPEKLTFKQLSLVEATEKEGATQVVVYRINIAGQVRSMSDLEEFNDFKEQLAVWELLKFDGYGVEIDESLQRRDVDTGIIPYTLAITLKPEKKAPAQAKEGDDQG